MKRNHSTPLDSVPSGSGSGRGESGVSGLLLCEEKPKQEAKTNTSSLFV